MIWNELPQHREPLLKLSLSSPLMGSLRFTELRGAHVPCQAPRAEILKSAPPFVPVCPFTEAQVALRPTMAPVKPCLSLSKGHRRQKDHTLQDASVLHGSHTEGVLANLPDPQYKKQKLFPKAQKFHENVLFLSFKIGILPICKYMYQKSENIPNLETE